VASADSRCRHDGWADAASDYADKCTEGFWTVGRDGAPIEPGLQLVATGTAATWMKWVGGTPAEYRVRKPGGQMPECWRGGSG
jgi:hypothetical protein